MARRKKAEAAEGVSLGGNSGAQLRSLIERIERMNEEKQAVQDDIKDIYAEAKGQGFDPKIMRIVIRRRAQDHAERMEQQALLDTYEHALGMVPAAE